MRIPIKTLATLFFIHLAALSSGQVKTAATDTIREFEILEAPSMRAIKIDSITTLQTLAGGAVIKQGSTIFYSDSAVLNPTTHIIEAFGNIHINQADSVHTYSQYLKYLGVEEIAYLKNDVKLTDNKGTLYTQELEYNLETGIANYYNSGKVIEGDNVITSVNGTYFADTKDVYFKQNVKLDGPKNHVRTDSLLYNMETKKTNFISETFIKNDDVKINTTGGTYDLKSGDAFFTSRTTIKDSSGRVYTADNIALEDKSGNAQLEGNAVIIDTANNFVVSANQIFLNKKNNSFLATRKPVLVIAQKHDSTYIAADTIFSGITTFVQNEGLIVKNDSVINVNPQQDQKVQSVEVIDSTERRLPVQVPDSSAMLHGITDSIAVKKSLDSLQIIEGVKDTIPSIKATDSIQIIEGVKDTIPSIKTTDSLQIIEGEKDTIPSIKATDSIQIIEGVKDTVPSIKATDSIQIIEGVKDTVPSIKTTDSLQIIEGAKDTIPSIKATDSLQIIEGAKDSTVNADSTTRYFLAFHHVRIFNDSLQSICDSMFFSSKDSVFRLYYEPVIWSGQTQITGDTIFLFTKNKEPQRLYAFENGFIVNKTKEGFFNQIVGRTINGYFKDSKIDYLRVKGSQAESIYYMQNEDNEYIGINRASGDVIDIFFKNEELKKVLFINEIKGTMFPMKQMPEDLRRLNGFEWLDDKRPKNKLELFE